MRCSADWMRRLSSRRPALGSGDMPWMNMFTGIIVVVLPVDVEATASGSVALSDRLVASTWALLGRGSDAVMSLGAVTGCGTLLVGAVSSRSVINDLLGRRRFDRFNKVIQPLHKYFAVCPSTVCHHSHGTRRTANEQVIILFLPRVDHKWCEITSTCIHAAYDSDRFPPFTIRHFSNLFLTIRCDDSSRFVHNC